MFNSRNYITVNHFWLCHLPQGKSSKCVIRTANRALFCLRTYKTFPPRTVYEKTRDRIVEVADDRTQIEATIFGKSNAK